MKRENSINLLIRLGHERVRIRLSFYTSNEAHNLFARLAHFVRSKKAGTVPVDRIHLPSDKGGGQLDEPLEVDGEIVWNENDNYQETDEEDDEEEDEVSVDIDEPFNQSLGNEETLTNTGNTKNAAQASSSSDHRTGLGGGHTYLAVSRKDRGNSKLQGGGVTSKGVRDWLNGHTRCGLPEPTEKRTSNRDAGELSCILGAREGKV
ncbi:unnamed protein product [Protopolystoma xenopodis]|uniref:Uncharacterized protein n=1 Tax=Protopolystoma xenopodis TaxID=117903 RepID=A0A448WAG9_9PLAT|nr:unnamed protein product [Protopolystoma xenopodis]